MKKIILMMTLFLLSFSYGFGIVKVKPSRIYLSEMPIKQSSGISHTDFVMEGVKIVSKDFKKENTYFKIYEGIIGDINLFISMSNMEIISSKNGTVDGKKIYSTGEEDYIMANISGRFRFNWGLEWSNLNAIKIGEIRDKDGKYKDTVLLMLSDIKIVKALNVKVDKHMNLGKGMAGEIFNTNGGTTKGTPAIISLIGGEKEKVKITIPKTTEIKNGKNSLTVNLNFREKGTNGTNSNEWELKKSFSNSGEIKDITIDGSMQTTKETPTGKYKGTFKVRAEYID